MHLVYASCAFLIGICIGSFLNVVVNRYNTGKNILGRSFCFTCGKGLTARELIPVLSYLWQGGKCRICRAKISWQYPIVEILTGIVFFLGYWKTVGTLPFSAVTPAILAELLLWWVSGSLLIAIAVYDLKHKIIPDGLVYALALFGALKATLVFLQTGEPLGLVAGPLLATPFAVLWLVSRGTWMGLGDAKLVLALGWLVGLSLGAYGVLYAFWSGALCGIALLLIQRFQAHSRSHYTLKSEIPFAPFLILGFALSAFFGPLFVIF